MDSEAWRASVHGVLKSQMWLSHWTEQAGASDLNAENIQKQEVFY